METTKFYGVRHLGSGDACDDYEVSYHRTPEGAKAAADAYLAEDAKDPSNAHCMPSYEVVELGMVD